ncbi:hypothetical protein BABINDRAFT_160362 [Babjeviella inositovora NRRL Y-12698]|uniref:Zn(2)-C6 fungal-type domain-containing protein n=1 Tax=Babjeviella inositovora NRRL Y-12698 TaxID=984486 RepID=A0A1E3QTQ9_9ASCO|nr:uncharacterized protein BABINDRAFT_160362 [Babjeviella inositovora NRRL Y-12698]ODQ80924.1 hypothetical protein BABINDRAFT_160362 [Babjeviella inositovora NRRL Y-12698]
MNYKSYQQVFSLTSVETPRVLAPKSATPPSSPKMNSFNTQLYTPPHSPQITCHSSCPASPLPAAEKGDKEDDSKPKKRTKTGCFTCRQRKKKCDEHIDPVSGKCTGCIRNFLDCSWPETNTRAVELNTCVVGQGATVAKAALNVSGSCGVRAKTSGSRVAKSPKGSLAVSSSLAATTLALSTGLIMHMRNDNKMDICNLLNDVKPRASPVATRFVITTV